ncbi:alpha/beta fold hydrolase [Serratia proteamaculans]|uniref:alpha/beta fold hydrolase n=1 Tax=Serratia proteamaculans TaxID=28151 RepID=UPI00107606AF|nr:alpha/beta fold hydrolase [Serratia proteamaculans]TFZ51060.1 alpha/beta fold hydrolase [Serratia proteamaculans]
MTNLTSANIGVVQRYISAFGKGDVDGALRLMTDDVVWHVDGVTQVSTVGLLKGCECVREWLQSFPERFQPRVFRLDNWLASNDSVMVSGYFRHHVISTGHSVGSDFMLYFRIRDGLIARYQIFEDSALLARAFDSTHDWERQRIRLNNTEYAYSDRGEGPVLIFAHGLFVDRDIFAEQVAVLERHYRCIVLDMPGHGESRFNHLGWSLDDIAEDLALMINELSLGPVIFIGQSQGGMVGIRLAARHQQLLSGLILIGTSAREEFPQRKADWVRLKTTLQGSDEDCEAAFLNVQQQVNAPDWQLNHPQAIASARAVMLRHDRKGLTLAIDAAVITRTDSRALLPLISAPTLVICGTQDLATPPELSEEIVAGITHASLLMMDGVGHHPPLEAASELAVAMEHFIRVTLSPGVAMKP